mgnify:CR=1 FL=1
MFITNLAQLFCFLTPFNIRIFLLLLKQCLKIKYLTSPFLTASECVYLLLAHGAPVKVKNNLGWSPLAEAISYGDRSMSRWLF